MNAKIDLEAIESKRFKDFSVETVRLLQEPKNDLHHQRTYQFIVNLGVTFGSRFNSSINGSDEMHRCESLRLSCFRWIGDGPSRSCHVACEEETHEMTPV